MIRLPHAITAIALQTLVLCHLAFGQMTGAITYQGELPKSGQLVSVTADLVFRLYDAARGGNQIGVSAPGIGHTLFDGRFPKGDEPMHHRLTITTLSLVATVAIQARAQTYELIWYTIDSGGEMFTFGGDYELSGTMGQHDAGTLAGGEYQLAGGFWPVAQASPPCIADFNHDGTVNTLDFLAFLNAWSSGDPSADINSDGTVNTLDVLAFLNLWSVGC